MDMSINKAGLRSEIEEVVQDADLWLESPNDRLGGLKPKDLLGTTKGRSVLHSLVQSIKHGMFT
jgi:uncharacterized protein (DUF2384 family)